MTPGRKPSISASLLCTSLRTVSTPSGFFRSTAMLLRLRASTSARGDCWPAELARSTRTTSAPISASIMPQNGPGPMPCSSMTPSPVSGPMVISLQKWTKNDSRLE